MIRHDSDRRSVTADGFCLNLLHKGLAVTVLRSLTWRIMRSQLAVTACWRTVPTRQLLSHGVVKYASFTWSVHPFRGLIRVRTERGARASDLSTVNVGRAWVCGMGIVCVLFCHCFLYCVSAVLHECFCSLGFPFSLIDVAAAFASAFLRRMLSLPDARPPSFFCACR